MMQMLLVRYVRVATFIHFPSFYEAQRKKSFLFLAFLCMWEAPHKWLYAWYNCYVHRIR